MSEKSVSFKIVVLITTPKQAEKAYKLFCDASIPLVHCLNARGTATNEIIDMLGLGNTDKKILLTILPSNAAQGMLNKISMVLNCRKNDSGIAFTIPLTGLNNLILHIVERFNNGSPKSQEEEERGMAETKYSMIAAVVNRGYSEEVMDAARSAGASGGSVVNSRRIVDEKASNIWGLNVQEEKEIVLIVSENDKKIEIMRAISKRCGIHSEAQGSVFSLPIESVIGLQKDE